MSDPRDLWFEDFTVGRSWTTRGATLSEAQIMDFAWGYDPQPFHIDKEAAAKWGYGGLIASGFQTLAVSFRLFFQERIITAASIGSPGIDELRWLLPVRPGDTLTVTVTVLEQRPSQSKPDRGVAIMSYETKNQRGEVVMTLRAPQLLKRRPK